MVELDVDEQDALDLLVAAPGTKEEKQEFFEDGFYVRVPKTNYNLMWERLVDQLDEDQAVEAVCALVLSSPDSRAIQLLTRAARGRSLTLRMNESALVDLLFDSNDELTAVGDAIAERLRENNSPIQEPPTSQGRSAGRPSPTMPPPTRPPVSTVGADVILNWHRAKPEAPDIGPWRWSACLYAYLHPATGEVLYIGKTADRTDRERFVSNFKRKFNDLYARLGIVTVDVMVARVESNISARLTREWLDDLESLLILRVQPPLNQQKRKSRSNTRPGTVVVCTGAWPLDRTR